MYIFAAIGPVIGFILVAKTTALYVDFDRVPAKDIPALHQYDPRWIGAWWLGFPVFSIVLIVAAIPMFFYPKMMRPVHQSCVQETIEDNDGSDSPSLMRRRRVLFDTSSGIVENFKGNNNRPSLAV